MNHFIILQVVYFTAIFPYLMLTLLLINGLRLEGATDGILYYIRPNFTMLYSPKVRIRPPARKPARPLLLFLIPVLSVLFSHALSVH